MSEPQIIFAYKTIREVLGDKLGLLGEYEFFRGNKELLTDYAISIPYLKPDPRLKFQMKSESGIEATLEGDGNPKVESHRGVEVFVHSYKLTLTQHKTACYGELEQAVKAIYSIPAIRPIDSPMYRSRVPVGGKDRSYLPAIAVMYLSLSEYPDFT